MNSYFIKIPTCLQLTGIADVLEVSRLPVAVAKLINYCRNTGWITIKKGYP